MKDHTVELSLIESIIVNDLDRVWSCRMLHNEFRRLKKGHVRYTIYEFTKLLKLLKNLVVFTHKAHNNITYYYFRLRKKGGVLDGTGLC